MVERQMLASAMDKIRNEFTDRKTAREVIYQEELAESRQSEKVKAARARETEVMAKEERRRKLRKLAQSPSAQDAAIDRLSSKDTFQPKTPADQNLAAKTVVFLVRPHLSQVFVWCTHTQKKYACD
jgi:hypothetical protein